MLPVQLMEMHSRWVNLAVGNGESRERAKEQATAELADWIGLIPLIEAMQAHPTLVGLYPSTHNALLRLSREPLHKDSDITYDLMPAFPLWCSVLPDGRFRATRYTPTDTRGWLRETCLEGSAEKIAAFVAHRVEEADFRVGTGRKSIL
jgi:hypothetical protein